MVTLLPLEQAELDQFLDHEIRDYAEEKVVSGNWKPEEALEKSRAEFQGLLPEGLNTKNQYLFSIFEPATGLKLGVMWYQMDEAKRRAFINDFVIEPAFRGKGYGKQAMQALHEKLQAMGVESVGLHVFGHNTSAIALYEKMGYHITNLYMSRDLKGSE